MKVKWKTHASGPMKSHLSNLSFKIGNVALGVHCSLQAQLFPMALAANNGTLGDSEA